MKILLIIFSIIVSLLMIYMTTINYKNKLINIFEYILWTLLWLIIIFLSIRPKILDIFINNYFGTSLFYIFTVLGFIFTLVIVFYFYNKIKTLENKVDTLIRSASLKKIYKKLKS